MGALNSVTTCFLALSPDDAFTATVLDCKRRVGRRIGPQLYLDDPPHLTLYLARFPQLPTLGSAAQAVAQKMRTPPARVFGWHVFRADPLNGNHTLVCDIDPEHRRDLAKCQQQICAAVSPLRDAESTQARYAPYWRKLPAAAQANVTQWGFPFVGSIWHPHVTIAAIRPADWDRIWPELENTPPVGAVRFPKLCLFALEEGRPVLLERFDLES
jgi:2'-5' RNA ligase